jgi:DNA-binding transcriptional MerR regulator
MKEVTRSIKAPKEDEKGHFRKRGERVNLLDEIRATEMPGKRGGDFFYAQAIYAYFSEIEALQAEGFTLATICKFLEKKDVLPKDSDPYSFRRAFSREAIRRKRATPKEVNINDTAKKGINTKANASKGNVSEIRSKHRPDASVIPVKPKNNRTGPLINPDNTFTITPVDPDDLPDIS